jgi:hypothetical protein
MRKSQMTKIIFEPSYDVDEFDKKNPEEIEYHFLGSNLYEWKTDVNFNKVFKWMAKQDHSFAIYFVPRHARASYEIQYGRPVGVDAHYLGMYHKEQKNV